jgi:hypothetical protein
VRFRPPRRSGDTQMRADIVVMGDSRASCSVVLPCQAAAVPGRISAVAGPTDSAVYSVVHEGLFGANDAVWTIGLCKSSVYRQREGEVHVPLHPLVW